MDGVNFGNGILSRMRWRRATARGGVFIYYSGHARALEVNILRGTITQVACHVVAPLSSSRGSMSFVESHGYGAGA